MEISTAAVDPLWKAAFGDEARPEIYSTDTPDDDGFLPLTDAQRFIKEFNNLTNQQLYAAGSNNQLAMKLAQDEYHLLSNLIAEISGRDHAKNPQALLRSDIFEDIKESRLYSYKYESHKPAPHNRNEDDITEREKQDVRLRQEPFEQGGFVPTERQYKSIMALAKDRTNPDGWKLVERNGRRLVPRQQTYREEYVRHERTFILDGGELGRPGTANSMDSVVTPSKPSNRQLLRTRFGGQKFPPTRDVSEAPSASSTPRGRRPNSPNVNGHAHQAHDGSPTSKRRKFDLESDAHLSSAQLRHHDRYISEGTDHPGGPVRKAIPSFAQRGIPPDELRHRKWTTEDLVTAVKHDHSWLTDDPVQSEQWKDKILASQFPVRTFSMFKKWAYWKQENRDKRPRNRGEGDGNRSRSRNVKQSSQGAVESNVAIDEDTTGPMVGNVDVSVENSPMKKEDGLGVEKSPIGLLQDNDGVEEEAEENKHEAIAQQIAEELQPSIEKDEESPREETPEDTIVAKAGSPAASPVRALSLAKTPARKSLRASRRANA